MYDVELTPAVVFAVQTASEDIRRRFFMVADHLATHPRPGEPSSFWDVGEHFDLVRMPLVLSGIFLEGLRVIYQTHRVVSEASESGRYVLRILAFSEGPNPVAGWETAR